MTVIQKFEFKNEELYRVWIDGEVKYCTLDEVMYILSTAEDEVKRWE